MRAKAPISKQTRGEHSQSLPAPGSALPMSRFARSGKLHLKL
jgi:hypothetical protein